MLIKYPNKRKLFLLISILGNVGSLAAFKYNAFKTWVTNSKEINNYVEKFEENGWVASSKIKEDTAEAFKSYKKWFSENKVSEKIIHNIMQQTKKWQSKGIKVYAFRFPTSHGMKNIENTMSGFNENEFSKMFRNAGGVWLDFSDRKFHSYDGSHLIESSAIKFSNELANKILKN